MYKALAVCTHTYSVHVVLTWNFKQINIFFKKNKKINPHYYRQYVSPDLYFEVLRVTYNYNPHLFITRSNRKLISLQACLWTLIAQRHKTMARSCRALPPHRLTHHMPFPITLSGSGTLLLLLNLACCKWERCVHVPGKAVSGPCVVIYAKNLARIFDETFKDALMHALNVSNGRLSPCFYTAWLSLMFS